MEEESVVWAGFYPFKGEDKDSCGFNNKTKRAMDFTGFKRLFFFWM